MCAVRKFKVDIKSISRRQDMFCLCKINILIVYTFGMLTDIFFQGFMLFSLPTINTTRILYCFQLFSVNGTASFNSNSFKTQSQ